MASKDRGSAVGSVVEPTVEREYVCVSDKEGEVIELPTEENGGLLLTTLRSQFDCATGLRFRAPDPPHNLMGIRLVGDSLLPPGGTWGRQTYTLVAGSQGRAIQGRATQAIFWIYLYLIH